jgi:hypothetical protein
LTLKRGLNSTVGRQPLTALTTVNCPARLEAD